MKRSTDRILTTHTGSLPRSPELADALRKSSPDLTEMAEEAVHEVVGRQCDTGIDVVNDGEQARISYTNYVSERLSGFGGEGDYPKSGDRAEFPEFAAQYEANHNRPKPPLCIGPVRLEDRNAVHHDIAVLKAALHGRTPADVFMTAASPGQIARFIKDTYYHDHRKYLEALAEAMSYEYRTITSAGFVLQLDCPDLASSRNNQFADLSFEDYRQAIQLHVDLLNEATAGIPPEQLRMHLCWGNYNGPHHRDVPLQDIVDVVLTARPSAISFEAANPRHEHEWALWRDVKLPEGKTLIPGMIDSTTNYIEHPELVAQRIERFAEVVGRENVIAGVDCGFGTFAGAETVDREIAWRKLRTLVEGAELASERLFG
jgi:5-methyltetrahydropteroyltriglutamate--homocysteine methyltransferase